MTQKQLSRLGFIRTDGKLYDTYEKLYSDDIYVSIYKISDNKWHLSVENSASEYITLNYDVTINWLRTFDILLTSKNEH